MSITRWTIGGVIVVLMGIAAIYFGAVTLSKSALVVGVVTWAGGIAAWLLTAAFEFRSRHALYREKKAHVRGACERDPEYAQTVGDLEEAVANQGFPRPSFHQCLYFTAYQPLLTLAIVSIPTFRPPNFSAWVPSVVNVFAMVVVLILTILHEVQWRDENLPKPWHPKVIFGAWGAYLALILWLAQACEEPSPAPQPATSSQPAPIKSP